MIKIWNLIWFVYNLTKKLKNLNKPKFWTFEVLGFFKAKNLGFFEAIFQPCMDVSVPRFVSVTYVARYVLGLENSFEKT